MMPRQQFNTLDVLNLEVADAAGTTWTSIKGRVVEMTVEREFLQVGELHAVIYDPSLDPATASTIRPGRMVRLTTTAPHPTTTGTVTFPLFVGKIRDGEVTYDLLHPNPAKRTRIEISAVDANAELANAVRPDGVATLAELAWVLAGTGVPWKLNGSTASVGTATVVSRNDQASALDQVAITTDTLHGVSWVDPTGTLVAWTTAGWAGTPASWGPSEFNTVERGFNTADCINTVTVRVQSVDPITGDATENVFGPYVDQPSIDAWGPFSAEFTVHGLNTQTEIDDFAAEVLAANATPSVTVRRVTAAVTRLEQLQYADRAGTIDLGREVNFGGQGFGVIRKLRHTITAKSWTVEYEPLKAGMVSTPTSTPSVNPGGQGTTLAELLRPVGEVSMWFGAKANCPAGWLVLDGATFDGATFPKLATLLGGTTLPNMTDRFPIGAGTKALGTSGGAPTVTLGAANLPNPLKLTATGSASGGTTENGGLSVAQGGTVGRFSHDVSGGSNTPVDVMPPWRALWFIIRAV